MPNILAIKYDLNTSFNEQTGFRNNLSKFRLAGCSDILCFVTLPDRKLQFVIFMEVKTSIGKQSLKQVAFENKIKKLSGFYYVVKSVSDAEKALERSIEVFNGRCI